MNNIDERERRQGRKRLLGTIAALMSISLALLMAFFVWSSSHRNRLTELEGFIGSSEQTVLLKFGPPTATITSAEIESGAKRFPPEGFVLKRQRAVEGKVLLYSDVALGYLCVFINKHGVVSDVIRAVS